MIDWFTDWTLKKMSFFMDAEYYVNIWGQEMSVLMQNLFVFSLTPNIKLYRVLSTKCIAKVTLHCYPWHSIFNKLFNKRVQYFSDQAMMNTKTAHISLFNDMLSTTKPPPHPQLHISKSVSFFHCTIINNGGHHLSDILFKTL